MRYDVFLSYRRKGGFETAKHLFDLLTKDGYKVCLDLNTLREGDFDKALLSQIDECQDFILIVDPNAFERCVNPDYDPKNDWLRQELAYALKQGKNIIPVLLSGASFPDNLPPDISQIAYKHGPSYSLEYYDSFYEKLKQFLHTKRKLIRRIWFYSASAVLVLAGAILYFGLSDNKTVITDESEKSAVVEPLQPTNSPETELLPSIEPVVEKVEQVVPATTTNEQNTVSAGRADNKQDVKKEITNITSEKFNQIISGSMNGCDYVDLGLSVMWATCNVGASKPSDAGLFIAWGEVKAKTDYSWTTYVFLSDGTNKDNAIFSKYNSDDGHGNVDNLNRLETTDDIANVMLSDKWRMPTKDEFDELVNNCTWKWTKVDGVDGYQVYSKKAGFEKNSIFLPAAGYYQKKSVQKKGSYGCYWSASLGAYSHSANYLGFNSTVKRTYNEERYIGRSIRPVCKKD